MSKSMVMSRSHPLPGSGPCLTGRSRAGFPLQRHPPRTRANLHQMLGARLAAALEAVTPEPFVVAMAVEVRFSRQLTRIPDLMVVRGDEPGRHWFAPAEVAVAIEIESPGNHVEDRTTKPALYAQFGIPHYWRLEPAPLRVTTYCRGHGDAYVVASASSDRLAVSRPFPVDLDLAALLPRWAR